MTRTVTDDGTSMWEVEVQMPHTGEWRPCAWPTTNVEWQGEIKEGWRYGSSEGLTGADYRRRIHTSGILGMDEARGVLSELLAHFPIHTIVTDGWRSGAVIGTHHDSTSQRLWLKCRNKNDGEFLIDPDRARIIDTIEQFDALMTGENLEKAAETAWKEHKNKHWRNELGSRDEAIFLDAYRKACAACNVQAAILVQMLAQEVFGKGNTNLAVAVGKILDRHGIKVTLSQDDPPDDGLRDLVWETEQDLARDHEENRKTLRSPRLDDSHSVTV